ncbi:MAG: nitronate monooxygenase, partial [Candidatus Aminicenantes bacterium]|nr:nitronate monooxygenase [Candidatus Aminicenantes bacterium]
MSLRTALEDKLACLREQCASKYPLPPLRIGAKTARLSIVQGGMGVGISLSNLAAAVAREGGIGVIAANAIGMTEDDYYDDPVAANVRALRRELREARRKSDGIIGVNIMVAVDCFHRLLDAAIEERADVLFLGAGLPIKGIPVRAIRSAGVQVVPIVSSARAARLIFKSWEKHYGDIPDGVVVEGPRAGGHLGFKPDEIDHPDFRLERIVPQVVETLREFEARWGRALPVIAAGGIFTGEDVYRFLKLGAGGAQLGTRFVATDECDADIRFKQAYVACREDDIVIIQSPVGLPGRAVRGPFLEAIARGEEKLFRCPSHCLESCAAGKARYCISEALDSARKGDLENGFVFCGANAHRVEAIVPVKQIVAALKQGYALAAFVSGLKTEAA